MHAGDSDELCKLYDKLNLTGRVTRLGQHAVTGGCANVWEARLSPRRMGGYANEEGEKVAVKVIREVGSTASETSLRKRLIREVRTWSTLHHRNVLPLFGFTYGFSPGSRLASLVSPWMPNGTARRYLEKRSASERIRVLTGVADGLCYLHRHDVVHGDLKGENIMIDMHFEPRIADFGLSKLLDEVTSTLTVTHTGSPFGSVRWTARELFFSPGVNYESDVWSFGMTVLELFTNAAPFRHLNNDAQVIIKVHNGDLPSRPRPSTGMDDALWDLCCDCWKSNPQLRPSTRVIAKRLWELDLKCKLLARKKRRASPSPERRRNSQESEGNPEEKPEGRLRKSPKLSTLAELAGDALPSPGSPLPMQRVLVRTPTRRSPGLRSASGSQSTSSSSQSSTGSFSRRSSRTDLVDEVDPRRLFASVHSDGDIYSTLHHHHNHLHRTQSEPMGLDLSLDDQSFSDDLGSDSSLVLATPRQHLQHSFETPPSAYAQLYPQYEMQQQEPFIMSSNSDLELLSQTEFLGGYDADAVHPSQWTSSYPPYTHAAFASSFPLQNGDIYYEGALSMQAQHPTYPFLLPPIPTEVDNFVSNYSPSENAVPSPHALGLLFSENFDYEEPQPTSAHTPPLLNEPLYNSPPPLYSNHQQYRYREPRHASTGTVDFASLQKGVISPALSDLSVPDPRSPPLVGDTPVMGGFGDDIAFGSEDEGEVLEEGLALFGGLDVSGNFSVPARSLAPPVDPDQTPHGSPRQLEFAPPLSLRAGHQAQSPVTGAGTQPQQFRMPPTPRLSPLLSSF